MKHRVLVVAALAFAGVVQAQTYVPDVAPDTRPGMVPGSLTPYAIGSNPGYYAPPPPMMPAMPVNYFRGIVMDAQIVRNREVERFRDHRHGYEERFVERDSLRLIVRRDDNGAHVALVQPLDFGRFGRGEVVNVVNQNGYWHAVR